MEELKIHNDGGFDIEIVEIYEESSTLRVITKCPFGKDNLGLSLRSKYIDLDGVPKWKKEVKKLLERKYGRWEPEVKKSSVVKKKIFETDCGIFNINDLDKPGAKKKNDK